MIENVLNDLWRKLYRDSEIENKLNISDKHAYLIPLSSDVAKTLAYFSSPAHNPNMIFQ